MQALNRDMFELESQCSKPFHEETHQCLRGTPDKAVIPQNLRPALLLLGIQHSFVINLEDLTIILI